jgi:hypothetical protein
MPARADERVAAGTPGGAEWGWTARRLRGSGGPVVDERVEMRRREGKGDLVR